MDEVKSTYRDLAMKNHPDRGGNTETMQAINREYAYACAYILKAANMEKEKVEEEMNLSQRYREVIEKIIHLPGIDIELCGHWIWVSGDTRPVKEALKAAGLQFASKKIKWYYRPEEFSVTRGGNKTMEEIREKYGSQNIRKSRNRALED
ncbi:hypothetical protein ACQ86N_22565 [Puia sp. P3]|uniref:hypothetical protein n=1 Tax=Puia sp. P3 TaxID=3423952 RepID=UPI003D665976